MQLKDNDVLQKTFFLLFSFLYKRECNNVEGFLIPSNENMFEINRK